MMRMMAASLCHLMISALISKHTSDVIMTRTNGLINNGRIVESKRRDYYAGLPVNNQIGVVANNPQFGLFVPRPCDLCITLSQTDDGMAIGETIECAMYVLRPSDENGRMAQESERVESLPMEKIVAHTGDPDLREQTIYCTLDPGYYTILCSI